MKRSFVTLSLVVMTALLLVACGATATPTTVQPPVVQTVVVTSIVEVEGTPQVVTETETITVTVVPEVEEATFTSEDPTTYVWETFGEPETLDTALSYESAGIGVMEQVYESLVGYNRSRADELVPELAAEMPEVSEDGLTYTFTIREGITFHNGNDLTAEDVAYSFQRGLLQGGYSSPQLLLTEPILGVGIYDISEVLFAEDPDAATKAGDPAAVQAAPAEALAAVCEQVQSAIVADGNTVTFTLAQPWAPFLQTLAGAGWGAINDMEWAVENGAWDGDCATWQNFYGISSENDPLTSIANGTGPYMLERWTPGEEIVLTANPNYWRNDETGPAFEGGRTGAPAIETFIIRSVTEFGTRFASLQAGDADHITVGPAEYSQMDSLVGERCDWNFDTIEYDCAATENANAPLRGYYGAPQVTRTDMMFTWNINVDGGNPLAGSGALDGNGIPADFFSDINVRRGFAYCMDWDVLINDVYHGNAVQNVGVVIPGMLGYNPEGSAYTFDADRCREELATAWGGVLPETGFRLQVAYNAGNTFRQTVGEILQTNLDAVSADNPTPGNYVVEVIGLPWANFLRNQREGRLPIFISGWHEDIHDPHNWVQPFLVGVYAQRMGLPEELTAQFSELIDAAVVSTDDAERQALYEQISELDYENVVGVRLVLPDARRYEQRWVDGWYFNPALSSGFDVYQMSKN